VRRAICGTTSPQLIQDRIKTADAVQPFDEWIRSSNRVDY
jgi:hypothetical protein